MTPPRPVINDPITATAQVSDASFKFRPAWWTARMQDKSWAAFLLDLPDDANGRGYKRISRTDLLTGPREATPDAVGRALLASYVWGTGSSAFLVPRRARVFQDTPLAEIAARLTRAVTVLHTDGPAAAYASLARGASNHIKHLGPSFYTKVLYATDAHQGVPGQALILDRLVAIALNDLHGWDLPENGAWTADQYQRWLDHAHRLAHQRSQKHTDAPHVRADAIEMAYFEHGRSIYDGRRRSLLPVPPAEVRLGVTLG